jgi:hypothetical protein
VSGVLLLTAGGKKEKNPKKKRVQKCFTQWGNGGPKERNFRKRAK